MVLLNTSSYLFKCLCIIDSVFGELGKVMF